MDFSKSRTMASIAKFLGSVTKRNLTEQISIASHQGRMESAHKQITERSANLRASFQAARVRSSQMAARMDSQRRQAAVTPAPAELTLDFSESEGTLAAGFSSDPQYRFDE